MAGVLPAIVAEQQQFLGAKRFFKICEIMNRNSVCARKAQPAMIPVGRNGAKDRL